MTGGPCGGKSTALSKIEQVYTERGYKDIFVTETATELIGGGAAPWLFKNRDFQIALLSLQTILEIELLQEDESVHIPEYLHVIREVTEDERYKNYSIAKSAPDEVS